MQIIGEWFLCDDGMPRPIVRAQVFGTGKIIVNEHFLVDTGADRTVFSAALTGQLQLSVKQSPDELTLVGIGGGSGYVLLSTQLEFTRDDGGPARVQGEFAAFTDPVATDLSILGRDVLNHFDVIVSRRRNAVLLLSPNHQYQVMRS
jgi:hypothetical protein